jgi:hypothetical protein
MANRLCGLTHYRTPLEARHHPVPRKRDTSGDIWASRTASHFPAQFSSLTKNDWLLAQLPPAHLLSLHELSLKGAQTVLEARMHSNWS